MKIQSLIKEPTTLTFVTTNKCSSACNNCCFQCSPKLSSRLTKDQMVDYMEQVKKDFPTIVSLVLTGGECTLLPELTEIIYTATHKYKLSVRIVSNAHWANNRENARSKVNEWKKAGLMEINFSTGDEHLEFVPIQNIKNAIFASVEAGLKPFVNVESQENHKFNCKNFMEDKEILSLVSKGKLIIANGIWIDFKHPEEIAKKPLSINVPSFQRCENIFNSITITPDNRMKACCGITSNNTTYLDLGNLEKHTIRHLFDNQFNDFVKIWLHTEGAHTILKFASRYEKRININDFAHLHQCLVCTIILRSKEIMSILHEHYNEIYSNVIMKYNMT